MSWLALRAVVSTPVPHNYPLNRSAAYRTTLAAKSVGNLELEVCRALGAIGPKVGINAGSFVANRCT